MISLTSPVETRAHSWPAGLKLALLCLATMVLFTLRNPLFHALAFSGCLFLYLLPGRLFFVAGLRRLMVLWPFLAVILVWHVLTNTAMEGTVVVLRLVTAVGLANLVTMTTKLSDMIDVVTFLTAPLRAFGLKTRFLELGIALVVRFVPALTDKGVQLSWSWRARSPKRPNWRIILPFTVLAIDDAEHVAEALRARGGL
jgi:biotin transport system permease protein